MLIRRGLWLARAVPVRRPSLGRCLGSLLGLAVVARVSAHRASTTPKKRKAGTRSTCLQPPPTRGRGKCRARCCCRCWRAAGAFLGCLLFLHLHDHSGEEVQPPGTARFKPWRDHLRLTDMSHSAGLSADLPPGRLGRSLGTAGGVWLHATALGFKPARLAAVVPRGDSNGARHAGLVLMSVRLRPRLASSFPAVGGDRGRSAFCLWAVL